MLWLRSKARQQVATQRDVVSTAARTAARTARAVRTVRLIAAGDKGPTTLCVNSEEGVDSPHSSNATELGGLSSEQRVRNREHLATSQHTALLHTSSRHLACTSPCISPHSSPLQR